jgi:hypothetical protein
MSTFFKQTEYTNDEGMAIYELIPMTWMTGGIGGEPERGKAKYFAMADHAFMRGGQQFRDRFRIDIPAESIPEAFAKLPGMLEPAQKKRLGELDAQFAAQSRQVVLPNGQVLPPKGSPSTRAA